MQIANENLHLKSRVAYLELKIFHQRDDSIMFNGIK